MDSIVNGIGGVFKDTFLRYLWDRNDGELNNVLPFEKVRVEFDTWLSVGKSLSPPCQQPKRDSSCPGKKKIVSSVITPAQDGNNNTISELVSKYSNYSIDDFMCLKLVDLSKICARFSLKTTGTKRALIDCIMKYFNTTKTCSKQTTTTTSNEGIDRSEYRLGQIHRKKAKRSVGHKVKPYICPESIDLIIDENGYRVHEETRLIFNDDDIVVGYKTDEDTYAKLTSEMLAVCKSNNFQYDICDTLELKI